MRKLSRPHRLPLVPQQTLCSTTQRPEASKGHAHTHPTHTHIGPPSLPSPPHCTTQPPGWYKSPLFTITATQVHKGGSNYPTLTDDGWMDGWVASSPQPAGPAAPVLTSAMDPLTGWGPHPHRRGHQGSETGETCSRTITSQRPTARLGQTPPHTAPHHRTESHKGFLLPKPPFYRGGS